jgi:hypothetical protein
MTNDLADVMYIVSNAELITTTINIITSSIRLPETIPAHSYCWRTAQPKLPQPPQSGPAARLSALPKLPEERVV